MSTIEEEERSNPPSRPLGDSEQIDSVVIPADIRRIVQDIPVRDLPTHRQVLRANDRQCWLCGQRMVQASRIKSHWQSTHPETWRLCHRHAQTEASSLSSIFRRPCDFCGSTARNTKLHSGQCPVMFQILALKWLDSQGKLDSIDPGHKIKAVKQKVQPPAYKSFISPLAQAFGKSGGTPNTSSSTTTMVAGTLTGMNSDSSHSVGKPPIRKIRDMLQPRTGNITDYFRRPSATATPTLPPQHVTISCQVRLRNPHNHCYANASILALLHGLSTATMEIDRLRFLTKVCLLAVAKNKEVLLSQMYLFRMLTPRWQLNDAQQDAAEYLHHLFSEVTDLQAIWDSRTDADGCPRIHTQGSHPVAMPIPRCSSPRSSLQNIVMEWHQSQPPCAFVHAYPLICVQLHRYIDNSKDSALSTSQTASSYPFTMIALKSNGGNTGHAVQCFI